MIKLRPYQTEARDAVLDHWQRGILNVLLAMATGTGKTETFLSVLAAVRESTPNFRALVIAHREELISQPAERVQKNWTHALSVPGIVMAAHDQNDAEIVVATVQTLAGRRKRKDGPIHMTRLKELLRNGRFTHLIIDEAHHATAPTYRRVVRLLRLANPDLLHLGVTATPKRTDEDGLKKVYDAVAYKVTIKDAIEKIKSLAPFVGMGFTLPVSLKGVRTIAGDYSEGALDRLLSADNVEQVIIEKWKEHAQLPDGSYRPTMAFCAGVMQAERLALAFRNAGIPAGFASGNTPKKERRKILREFKQGKTRVLCNCALWTEGMDAPSISCVIMARPTKSDLVYIQAIGRGLRLFPGKDHCLIMDFAPMDGRDLVMSGDLLGVPKEQRKAEERAKEEDTVLDIFGLLSKQRGIDADPDAVQVAVLDYFSRHTPLRWTHDGRVASASLAEKLSLAVVFPQEERVTKADELREAGQWSDRFDSLYEQISSYQVYAVRDKSIELLGMVGEWSDALSIAEDFADDNMDQKLAMKTASWRNDPPSIPQKQFAVRLGTWQDNMSKGQTAQAITHGLTLQALRKNRVIQ